MSRVKTEIEPGLYETTYTTRNKNGQESVVRVIEQVTLDIPCDTTVKQEPIDEPLDSELDTLATQEAYEIEDIKIENGSVNCSNSEYSSNRESPKVKSIDDINSGIEISHSKKSKRNRYTCNQCSNTFLHKKTFKTHLLTHESVIFNCARCSQSFTRKASLKTHLLTHLT
uniref:C2H2-type domain-containing protein n=1 Tax=Cacopsylla melanoneura TaxID=428564 RepID=A0A8D8WCD8_9HEMI